MADQPKNVLVLWTDQQRPDTIAAYGRSSIRAPHLDRLAATGALFEAAYCAQPVCSPSRASFLTGLFPHAHGVTENNVPLPAHVPTLAERLAPQGYTCGYVGKWHLGCETQAQRGFAFWRATEDGYVRSHESEPFSAYHKFLLSRGYVPRDPHRGGLIFSRATAARLPEEVGKPAFQAAECMRFLEEHHDRPFLLMCNFLEPHPPVTGPSDGTYAPEEMTLPDSWYGQMEPTVPLRYRQRADRTHPGGHYGELKRDDEWGWKELKARYWGLASLVDTYCGKFLDKLDGLGLAENTIVVFSSDHGDMMGEHRLLNKGVQFDGAARVPLIVRVPGAAPRRVTTPVSLVGVVPTLLEAIGMPAPERAHARSALPLIQGAPPMEAEAGDVVVEWTGFNGYEPALKEKAARRDGDSREWTTDVRTIRSGRWKLNVHLSREHELYDLKTDPGERHNTAHDAGSERVMARLHERLLAWQRRTGDTLELPDPVDDVRARRAGTSG